MDCYIIQCIHPLDVNFSGPIIIIILHFFDSIHWKKAWLLPEKFCISNKIREVYFKILHNVCPTNSQIAYFFISLTYSANLRNRVYLIFSIIVIRLKSLRENLQFFSTAYTQNPYISTISESWLSNTRSTHQICKTIH